jgi:DedD protein
MASEQIADKENQFRKRARRRLVGAVALVLLMVTVLPMVLDDRGEQKTPQPEIAISIPSQDGTDFSSKIVPVVPESTPPASPGQMASPVAPPQAPVAAAPQAVEPKVPAAASDKAKPAAVTKTIANAPAESKLASPSVKPAAETVKTDEVKSAAPAAAVKKGTFSVQIGVFSDAAKVKQKQEKIAEDGIHCYTENLNTAKGTKIRLRCGPYAGKPEAQQALEKLKAAGFDGILVTNQ